MKKKTRERAKFTCNVQSLGHALNNFVSSPSRNFYLIMEFHLHPVQGSKEEKHTQCMPCIDTTWDCCLVKTAFILKIAHKSKDGARVSMAVPDEPNSDHN